MRRECVRLFGGVVAAVFIALAGGMAEHGWARACEADCDVILPDRCKLVCEAVQRGEISWWDAFLLGGCWCDGANNNSAAPPSVVGQIAYGIATAGR